MVDDNLYKIRQREIDKYKQNLNRPRYSDEEVSLIGNTFFDHDEWLDALRKFFLQGELSEEEKSYLKQIGQSNKLLILLGRFFLPQIEPTAPVYRIRDLWMSVDVTNKLTEDAYVDMLAIDIVIKYLKERFNGLGGNYVKETIKLNELATIEHRDKERSVVELKARNAIINQVDKSVEEIRKMALRHKLKMGEAELEKKLLKNSNK